MNDSSKIKNQISIFQTQAVNFNLTAFDFNFLIIQNDRISHINDYSVFKLRIDFHLNNHNLSHMSHFIKHFKKLP